MSTTPNTPNLPAGVAVVPAEPTLLRAGDSWKWCRTFEGYAPGEGWALQYVLNSPGGALFKFPAGTATANADGTSFEIALTAAQTDACAAGTYDFYAVLLNSGLSLQQTMELQSVTVAPNIASASVAVDTRSFAKKTLDIIEAAIAGDTSPHVQEYEVHGTGGSGRRVRYMERKELFALRNQFRLEYRQEQIAAGEFVPKRSARIQF